MAIRLLMIAMFALVLSGCATTSNTSPVSQLQVQLTELQQRMEDQEKEIVDLKYEVKEISGKVIEKSVDELVQESAGAAKPEAGKAAEASSLDIIKVNVSGYQLQKALKAAGVYEGKVDGIIGAKTKGAVVEFQKAHGLKADGVVGQKTWSELKAYLNPPAAKAEGASSKE